MTSRQRHVPLRRCVGCGTQHPQRELVRIVKTPEGRVTVDQGLPKMAGRGVYLCHSPGCWENGLKKNRLDHALRGRMSLEERQLLEEFGNKAVQQT